jgi:hypothetical protein
VTEARAATAALLLDALHELTRNVKSAVPDASGYALADDRPGKPLHVECVLGVHGPQGISGSEEDEVEILFVTLPPHKRNWIELKAAMRAAPSDHIAYLEMASPTGDWELLHPPVILPSVDTAPDDYADELRRYATDVVRFIRLETETVVDHLRDRALTKRMDMEP